MDGDEIVISGGQAEFRLIPAASATPDQVQARFRLSDPVSCQQPVPFLAGAREGYLFQTTGYLAEVSAPAGTLSDYESTFQTMLAALPGLCAE